MTLRRIDLDFVPIRRAPGLFGWLLLALGLLCLALEIADGLEARADLAERSRIVAGLAAEHARQQREARATQAQQADTTPVSAQEQLAVRRLASQLDADWNGVFVALSRVRNEDVAWLEVELQGEGRGGDGNSLRLTGQARSLEAVLAALGRMRAEKALAGAELVSHEAVTVDGLALVRFVVNTARGNGA